MPKYTTTHEKVLVKEIAETVAKLRKMAAKAVKDTDISVAVGYSAPYALHVHEDLQTPRARGKSAKFLEKPAMAITSALPREILTGNMTFAQKLIQIGLKIQKDSEKIVPVDTGQLRRSAFTTLERGR